MLRSFREINDVIIQSLQELFEKLSLKSEAKMTFLEIMIKKFTKPEEKEIVKDKIQILKETHII